MTTNATPRIDFRVELTRKNRSDDQLDLLEDASVRRQVALQSTIGGSEVSKHSFADKIDPSASLSPTARASDPDTSHDAAEAVRPTRLAQMRRLLEVYAEYPLGLTDEEACDLAGIENGWRRCSDLRTKGWIAPFPKADGGYLKRRLASGLQGRVCVITLDGAEELL